MTTEDATPGTVGPAKRRTALKYGMAPVIVGGGLLVALIGGIAVAGPSAIASALGNGDAPVVSETAQSDPTVSPSGTDGPDATGAPAPDGTSTPAPDPDSTTPPDRDSDLNGDGIPDGATPSDQDEVYVVQPGDTLSSLSLKFGMSVDHLAQYNGIVDFDMIYEDSALRVPYIYVPPTPEG